MHDHLKQLGTDFGNAPGQKEIVQYKQIRVCVGQQNLGLFRLGERAEIFPPALIQVFETIMQEEARHILFIVNWAAYLRARRPMALRPPST